MWAHCNAANRCGEPVGDGSAAELSHPTVFPRNYQLGARLLLGRYRAVSPNHLRTKVWNRSAAGVETASRTRSNDTVWRTSQPRMWTTASDWSRNSAAMTYRLMAEIP